MNIYSTVGTPRQGLSHGCVRVYTCRTNTIMCAMPFSAPLCDATPEAPVFGPQFTCRAGLAHNLLSRCLRRQSILLYGGPKLGKTSLLLHLKWLVDQQRGDSSAMPPVLYLDMRDEAARAPLLLGRPVGPASILLLDHCDHLLTDNCIDALRKRFNTDFLEHGIVAAGGRSWRDFVVDQPWAVAFRPAPLAVLVQGEARQLLTALAPIPRDAALGAGGTHPYVLKMVAQHMLSFPEDPLSTIRMSGERLVPFFEHCRDALGQSVEHTLLKYLVHEARPITPREAAVAVGLASIKSIADTLCWLGVISRWNLSQGAMLQANCRLFNDWYMATAC